MGRPRAVKMKDRTPSISSTEMQTNKRKVFTEDDECSDDGATQEEVPEPERRVTRRSTRARSMSQDSTSQGLDQKPTVASSKANKTTRKIAKAEEETEDEDEAPEVISSLSKSAEIEQLQRLHEMVTAGKKASKKKRKLKQANREKTGDGDAELDVSVFEEVQQFEAAGGRQRALREEDEDNEPANQRVHFSSAGEGAPSTISKQIGNVTVQVLDSDATEGRPNASAALASFGQASKARDFLQHVEQGVSRTRFAQFAGQKCRGPAKKFKLN